MEIEQNDRVMWAAYLVWVSSLAAEFWKYCNLEMELAGKPR